MRSTSFGKIKLTIGSLWFRWTCLKSVSCDQLIGTRYGVFNCMDFQWWEVRASKIHRGIWESERENLFLRFLLWIWFSGSIWKTVRLRKGQFQNPFITTCSVCHAAFPEHFVFEAFPSTMPSDTLSTPTKPLARRSRPQSSLPRYPKSLALTLYHPPVSASLPNRIVEFRELRAHPDSGLPFGLWSPRDWRMWFARIVVPRLSDHCGRTKSYMI